MLLAELFPTNVTVFHQTTVRAANGIFHQQGFKLTPEGYGNDVSDKVSGLYYLSVARSINSDFISRSEGGNVLLVLNRARLQAHNRIVPHHYDFEETGDEMEDRVYSKVKFIGIRRPINNTILEIRVTGNTSYNCAGSARYTEEDFTGLMRYCKHNDVPIFLNGKQVTYVAPHELNPDHVYDHERLYNTHAIDKVDRQKDQTAQQTIAT